MPIIFHVKPLHCKNAYPHFLHCLLLLTFFPHPSRTLYSALSLEPPSTPLALIAKTAPQQHLPLALQFPTLMDRLQRYQVPPVHGRVQHRRLPPRPRQLPDR